MNADSGMDVGDESAPPPTRGNPPSPLRGDVERVIARDLEEWSAHAAELFVTLAQRATEEEDGRFTVALAGGSTPRRLYRLLATPHYASQVPWERVQVFWSDERHVPPDDPESNYGMADEALLSKVPLPAENVHRVRAELPDAAAAARAYEDDIRGLFNLQPDQLPRFDLVLLGVGPDGHTASLFPGTDVLHESEPSRLVAAPWVEKLNTYRITLTPAVLNAAETVAFLVAGSEKAAILHDVLDGPRQPDLLPAQLIMPSTGTLIWMLDAEAAAQLETSDE